MNKAYLKLNIQKNIYQKILNIHGIQSQLHGIEMREKWKQWQILFSWAPKPLWTLTAATKLKDACSLEGRKAMKNLHTVLKSRDLLCYKGL